VYTVVLESLMEESVTTVHDMNHRRLLVKTKRGIRISCKSGNIITVSVMISFLRTAALKGAGSKL
jgi:hypothetical protein